MATPEWWSSTSRATTASAHPLYGNATAQCPAVVRRATRVNPVGQLDRRLPVKSR